MPAQSVIFLGVLCLLAFGRTQASGYTFTDLGTGSAVDINNSGVIALNDGINAFRVQVSERQQITNIFVIDYQVPGVPPYTNYETELSAQSINDAGHIGGVGRYSVPGQAGFLNLGDAAQAFGNAPSGVHGINNSDAFAGWETSTASLIGGITGQFGQTPAYHRIEGLNYCQMWAINDAGVAVGFGAETDPSPGGIGIPNPFRYTAYRARALKVVDSVIVYLDSRSPGELPIYDNARPGVRLSEALAINQAGDVVGRMATVADGTKHAFRHVGGGMEDLGTLGGDSSQANDINDSGVIVGESTVVGGAMHAFKYEEGSLMDLNTLLPAGVNAVFTRALAINNQGQIVGEALIDGSIHGVLLSPETLPNPPRITRQPEDVTVPLGSSVTVSVTAVGGLPLTYQWEKDTVALDGQTASTLNLTQLKGFDSGKYRVVVNNAGGRAISDAAMVTVLDPQLTAHTLSGLTLVGEVGATYRIEFRLKANAGTWEPLETVLLTNSPQWWVDFASSTNPMRIYQAVRLP